MRTLGNIIWHIPFLGFLFALAYALGGLFFCITIIGIPIGLGWLQFSLFLLSPFSKAMVSRKDLELLTGQNKGMACTHSLSLYGFFISHSACLLQLAHYVPLLPNLFH